MNSLVTILTSLSCRGVQVFCSILVVRYLVGLLGVPEYGAWVTMTAAMVWMSLFDFGVGYGIKNRIAELHAMGRQGELMEIASVAMVFYALATLVVSAVFLAVALLVHPFAERPLASVILFAGASATFFTSLGGIVLQGLGAFRAFYALSIVGPVLWMTMVLLHGGERWSVMQAALFFVGSTLVQALATLSYGLLRAGGLARVPLANCLRSIRSLVGVGSGFLVSQLSNISLFMSGNFIVYRSLGPEDAAIYDTTNKFFQFFIIGFSILVNIAWTRISQSKAIGDLGTTKRIYRLLVASSLAAGAGALIFSLVSDQVVSVLTRGDIRVETSAALLFVPLILVQTLAYSGSVFLNAYEELRIQNLLSVAAVPLFFGLVHVFLVAGARSGAVPLASACAILPSMLYCLHRGYRLATRGKGTTA